MSSLFSLLSSPRCSAKNHPPQRNIPLLQPSLSGVVWWGTVLRLETFPLKCNLPKCSPWYHFIAQHVNMGTTSSPSIPHAPFHHPKRTPGRFVTQKRIPGHFITQNAPLGISLSKMYPWAFHHPGRTPGHFITQNVKTKHTTPLPLH